MKKMILDWLFYDWLINVIEEEFGIDVYFMVNGKQLGKSKMKYVPIVGCEVAYYDDRIFKVLNIRLSMYGSVAYLNCEVV